MDLIMILLTTSFLLFSSWLKCPAILRLFPLLCFGSSLLKSVYLLSSSRLNFSLVHSNRLFWGDELFNEERVAVFWLTAICWHILLYKFSALFLSELSKLFRDFWPTASPVCLSSVCDCATKSLFTLGGRAIIWLIER